MPAFQALWVCTHNCFYQNSGPPGLTVDWDKMGGRRYFGKAQRAGILVAKGIHAPHKGLEGRHYQLALKHGLS